MISERTKAGLAAAKARGVKLGGPKLAHMNILRWNDATERARALQPVMEELAHLSAHAAARELNARGIATPQGAGWSAKTVIRLRQRLAPA